MLKRQILACMLAVLGILYMAPSAAATLSFSPSNSTVNRGDTVNVDVVISDLFDDFLGAQALVGAFDFTVGYDPTIISNTGVSFSGALGDPDPFAFETITGFDNSVAGQVNAFNVSLLFDLAPLQPDPSFTLATLSFQGLDIGVSSLDFLSIIISDDLGLPIDAQGISGSVSVVPLPGAVWLMITGLLGIGALARKGKKAA